MNLLQRSKNIVLFSLFTGCLLVMAVHAQEKITAGNQVTYFINGDNTDKPFGCGLNSSDQLYRNRGNITSYFTTPHRVLPGYPNGCTMNCHGDKGTDTKDIAPSKYETHTLLYDPFYGNKMVIGHGQNDFGQLGNSRVPDFLDVHNIYPYTPPGEPPQPPYHLCEGDAEGIESGFRTSYVIFSGGELKACGWNDYGQLGDGSTETRDSLVNVKTSSTTPLTNITSVSAGAFHTLMVNAYNMAYVCGRGGQGQLGLGGTSNRYYATGLSGGIDKVAAGAYHSVFLSLNGSVYTCGFGAYGQLGTGSSSNEYSLTFITNGATDIAAGAYYTLVLKGSDLYVTGLNNCGQLGLDDYTTRYELVYVTSGVVLMAAGYDHTVIKKDDGKYYACGNNWVGQCGTGEDQTFYKNFTPVAAFQEK